MKAKNIFAILSAVAVSMGGMSALAQTAETADNTIDMQQQQELSNIMPCFTAIADGWNGLLNEGNGRLKCTGGTTVLDGYTAGTIMELQQYQNGGWTTIKTWSGMGNSEMRLGETWYVVSGSYQVKVTHIAFLGNSSVETYISYSRIVNV